LLPEEVIVMLFSVGLQEIDGKNLKQQIEKELKKICEQFD
jgi:hypothetical protein